MANIEIPDRYAQAPLSYVLEEVSPRQSQAMFALSKAVYQDSILPLREFELARALVAQINGCLACRAFRGEHDIPAYLASLGEDPARGAHRNGPPPSEADYLAVREWRTSPLYGERDRLALEFAERFSLEPDPLGYDGAFWARLRASYSDAEICELALAVANFVSSGRFAHVMGFDQTSCTLEETFAAGQAQAVAAE